MAEAPGNTDLRELSWRSPFQHQDAAPSNSLQAPELECLRPDNQQDRNIAPPISRQAAQSRTELIATSKRTPRHGPARHYPAIPLLSIYPEEIIIQKDTCTPIFNAALFTIAKIWKQPKCPSTEEWIKKVWYIYAMEYYSAIKKTK